MTKLIEHKSPFEEWPGSIFIPETINATDFNIWWEIFNDLEDAIEDGEDKRHSALTTWQSRFHLIKKHTLKLGKDVNKKPFELEPTGLKLPSVRIALWFLGETDEILETEMSLKNSQGSSTTTKK